MAEESLYQKFQTCQQAALRLDYALAGFFGEDTAPDRKQAYGNYLRIRIRPAVQRLLEREETEKLPVLEAQGWLQASVLDDCLSHAIRQRQVQGYIWLLHCKARHFGFRDRDLSL